MKRIFLTTCIAVFAMSSSLHAESKSSASHVDPANNTIPPAKALEAEMLFWQSIMNSSAKSDYDAYMRAYPKGHFIELAHARWDALTPANERISITHVDDSPAKPSPSIKSVPTIAAVPNPPADPQIADNSVPDVQSPMVLAPMVQAPASSDTPAAPSDVLGFIKVPVPARDIKPGVQNELLGLGPAKLGMSEMEFEKLAVADNISNDDTTSSKDEACREAPEYPKSLANRWARGCWQGLQTIEGRQYLVTYYFDPGLTLIRVTMYWGQGNPDTCMDYMSDVANAVAKKYGHFAGAPTKVGEWLNEAGAPETFWQMETRHGDRSLSVNAACGTDDGAHRPANVKNMFRVYLDYKVVKSSSTVAATPPSDGISF